MDIVIAEMLFAAAAEIIMDNFRNVSFKTPSVKVSEKCKFLSAREEEKKALKWSDNEITVVANIYVPLTIFSIPSSGMCVCVGVRK